MESAFNLENIFRLLFQERRYRSSDEIITIVSNALTANELRRSECQVPLKTDKILTSIELLLKLFKNNFDARFNPLIAYIFDQIKNIVQSGIHGEVLSNLPLSDVISVIEEILDISITYSCKSSLIKMAVFYSEILCTLKKDISTLSEEELIFRLRIISAYYDVIIKKRVGDQTKDIEHLISGMNTKKDECGFFASLVFNNSKPIAAQALINITPGYVQFSKSNEILRIIWDKILESLGEKTYEFSEVFTILCYLSDFYFVSDNKDLVGDIFGSNRYWTLIQNGLMHSDSHVRKQGLFLLKKSCHFLKENEINLTRHDGVMNDDDSNATEKDENLLKFSSNATENDENLLKCSSNATENDEDLLKSSSNATENDENLLKCSSNATENDENLLKCSSNATENDENLLKCSSDSIFDVLCELWCIIEFLEEKQIHLLNPMIDVIDSFIALNEKNIHISWILIIFRRMISHDNVTIIKKGFLNMLKVPICTYHNEVVLTDAVKILVSTLNCTQLYSAGWQMVVDELKMYFDACSKQGNGKEFFQILINEMSTERWSPEALFFVTYCLHFVEPEKYWGKNELELTKKILNGTLNHYTYIKSAIHGHLLHIAVNFLVKDVALDEFTTLITCFVKKTCLVRETVLWKKIVKYVRESYKTEDIENYLKKSVVEYNTNVNIGKIVLILYDAHSDDQKMTEKMTYLLKNLLSTFISVHIRPYFDAEIQEFYLSIICSFMHEGCGDAELLKIFRSSLPGILKYIEMRLDSLHHIKDFEKSQNLLRMLDTVFNFSKNDGAVTEVSSEWFDKIMEILFIEPAEFRPLEKFIQLKTLSVILAHNLSFVSPSQMENVGLYLKSELCVPIEKTAEELSLTEDLQKLWGKMNSEYLNHKWELLSHSLDSPVDVLQVSKSDFVQLCLEALDTGGSAVLLPLINTLGKALPSLLTESQLRQLMYGILNEMMDRRKNDDFYQLVQAYVRTTFQLSVIGTTEEDIREMLLDHSQKLFSGNNVNVANMFLKHIQNLEFHPQSGYFLLDLLPRALLFGQIQRKDERLLSNICSVIEKENLSPLINDFSTAAQVRAKAVQIVVSLDQGNKEHCTFAETLADALIKFEEDINKSRTRYFAHSHVHRYKERLMQSLLLLEGYLSQAKSVKLWKWLCLKIITENNQPSVRYLQEWLILRLMYRNSHLKDELWKYFDDGIEKRTGSLCSLITIVYHSVKCIPGTEIESWIDNAVQKFLPYCMAQHFGVRLYAQVTLEKLLDFTKKQNLIPIIEKYGIIADILSQSIKSGNAIKNCAKMREDFYFTVFDPVDHYSLETIFYEFPRLTSVGSQELISPSLFEQYGMDEKNCSVPVWNKNESLKFFTCGKWIVEGSSQIDVLEDVEENKEMELPNLQKKMIPIKYLVPDAEDLHQLVSYNPDEKDDKVSDGLIVVGSLIDRLPNLGGLSRTCEIFGASEFVIASLKYLEDQQFKSLSVTAEKWVPITEVKPQYLRDYLLNLKKNGYKILAAEQTVNSQPLGSVKFPKKSVLLLGNEKEGIPPNLLPLMDVCVEIPQKGIIRSLNVHVTGALFIWEYAKQHDASAKQHDASAKKHDASAKKHDDSEKQHDDSEKQHDDSEKQHEDSEKQHDDSEKQHDDSEKQHDDSEKQNDDSEKQHGDSEKQNDNSDKQHGDSEKQHDDSEKQHDDSEKQNDDSEKKHDDSEKQHDDSEKQHDASAKP